MKKYDNYKDSGIEWIGEIPEHWISIPMRFLLRQKITDGPHETPQFIAEGIPFLSVDGIQNGELVFEGCRKISEEDHSRYKQKCVVEKQDILMGKAASVGKVAQVKVDFEFSIWSPLALLKPNHNKITSAYFEYFLKSTYAKDNANILSTFNTQQNISMTDIPRIYYIIPNSIEEQTAIAHYLDRKTAEIDELIADKKRLLELYNEEKTAIINQAVTKGINPNVPMKDTGIEWLGEIPEHWELIKLAGVCSFVRGNSSFKKDELLSKGNYVALQYGKTYKVDEVDENFEFYVNDKFFKDSQVVNYGDVIIISTSETIEDLGHSVFYNRKDIGLLGGEQMLLKPNSEMVNGKYLYFSSKIFPRQLQKYATGLKVYRFNISHLKTIYISNPPLTEQKTIVHHIETECALIDAKSENTKNLIDLLTEYRTALISEVVTGKIKVT